MIKAAQLTRRFGRTTVVDDVTFEVERGEVVGFLGPNGAGKTTTLRMLTGFLPPSRGTASIAGFDVLRDSLEVRRRLGYLPESVPLYAEHRVEEMLLFQGRLHGLDRRAARTRGAEVLERVGLGDRASSLIGRLSKGQRQRVGLAVALLPEPEVLILDEPTSGLDPLQRLEVRGLIQELAENRTVLISSHILPEVEAIAPRVIVLNHGKIAADGTAADLIAASPRGAFVRLEAMVGFGEAPAGAAAKSLGSLESVDFVRDLGPSGIYRAFEVVTNADLREDVGAVAMQKGWAVRELSWHAPTLEELFTRIALGLDASEPLVAQVVTPTPVVEAPRQVLFELEVTQPEAAPPQPPPRVLNPFATPMDGGTPGGTPDGTADSGA